MSASPQLETYLGNIRAHLRSCTASEEEEVVREISLRVEALAAKPDMTIESAISQVGRPSIVAPQYRNAILIAKAGKSWSPTVLLQASLKNGVPGVLAFVVCLAGYWIGGFALVFGVLSLLWSAVHYSPHAQIAIGSSVAQMIEPAVSGAVILAVTTLLLRVSLRMSKRVLPPL
jgi:ABC-type multidrug transport system permease subunit